MARYRNAQPRRSQARCEACGELPPQAWHREVRDGRTIDVRAHATTRVRVDVYYAQRAGRVDLADKRVCNTCYVRIIVPHLV